MKPTVESTLRALGWTAEQLADVLGIHPNTVARMKRGELDGQPYLWRALRDVLWEYRAPP